MSKGSFTLSLQAFVEQTGRNADTVLREATLSLLNAILLRSPVDTGRFRGNWNVGEQPDYTVRNESYAGSTPESRGAAAATESMVRARAELQGFHAGQQLVLANGLPYGIELEYHAHSKQAPNGFVRLALKEYDQYLRRAAAALPK
jgi:hypothetical protein